MMYKFKVIHKKDNIKSNQRDDINLDSVKETLDDIQYLIDECWKNNNITATQRIYIDKLFPNGKPSQEVVLTIANRAQSDFKLKNLLCAIEKDKRKLKMVKTLLLIVTSILFFLLLIGGLFKNEKNDDPNSSKAGISTFMQD